MKSPAAALFFYIAGLFGLFCHAQSEDNFPVGAYDQEGFALATPGVTLAFPRDHGSHPKFRSEWWYVTGHLDTKDESRSYGFQITFFRAARLSNERGDSTSAEKNVSQIYMAHAALLDKKTGKFHFEERLNSSDWNADAEVGRLDLYNGNWYLRMIDSATEKMVTRFSIADVGELTLALAPNKPKALFGEQGYSKKGDVASAASYYITFSRLQVSGTIAMNGETSAVSGQAWMDHEFSSSQLTSDQIGWNWSSLQLDDGSELMAYVMRREDGQIDPHSRLTIIDRNGETTELTGGEFSWTPLRLWESPDSGARYPVDYRISWQADGVEKRLTVKAATDNQELLGKIGGFIYWEGAGEVFDEHGNPIGVGYTELTGYDKSLQGRF